MSISGRQRLELEAEQRERIRIDGVRAECAALVSACDKTLASVRDVAVQQLAGSALAGVASGLAAAKALVAARPDEARGALERVHRDAHAAIAGAEAQARAWVQAQIEAVGRARALADRSSAPAAVEAVRRAEAGDVGGASSLSEACEREIETARTKDFDERVRRAVVKALLTTLKDMGFVAEARKHEGVVVLDGRLASGRRARFEVSIDGQMEFELDGYEGRACEQDLEKVETTLRDKYGVKLGPDQTVWRRNPDRLTKGAMDLPAGTKKRGG